MGCIHFNSVTTISSVVTCMEDYPRTLAELDVRFMTEENVGISCIDCAGQVDFIAHAVKQSEKFASFY